MPIIGAKQSFDDTQIAGVPHKPGVYALYVGDTLIYYGSSITSVRARLESHKNGHDGPCTQRASDFAWEQPLVDPEQREADLLEEYRQVHGGLPECNDQPGSSASNL